MQYEYYQWLSKTDLNQTNWTLGEIWQDTAGLGQFDFSPVYIGGKTNQFFRAHHAPYITFGLSLFPAYEANAVAPSPIVGSFYFNSSTADGLTIYYTMSGTASNGVDYTNLTGTVTIPNGSYSANVFIYPYSDALVEGAESVVLTVQQSDSYLIYGNPSVTNEIKDSPIEVSIQKINDAVEINGPPGVAATPGTFAISRIDYSGLNPAMRIPYVISGTASNGVDYLTISNSIAFMAGETSTNLLIWPVHDTVVEIPKTVTITLQPTNTMMIDSTAATATLEIVDTSTTVGIQFADNAVEPNPESGIASHVGQFTIRRDDTRFEFAYPLTVSYEISGTASNGVDYTNLSGIVTIQANQTFTNIFIEPLSDHVIEGEETVIVTLTYLNDGYAISSEFASATNTIRDHALFLKVLDLSTPVGIDYHQPSNALIVSCNLNGKNFARLFTNAPSTNLVVTNWSGVSGVGDEIKLFTVKHTANGFTNGEVFFSSGTGIGWISPDGSRSNVNWCILTNSFITNGLPIRGGLCMDETGGLFSNQLLVATSPGTSSPGNKSLWRIQHNGTNGIPTWITNIATDHLEGLITLTNDATKWGPWAGRLITGDEDSHVIYTIAANGVVTPNFSTNLIAEGIKPEDFDLVPANQDLYCCADQEAIYKFSRYDTTNFVGQLLITQAGEVPPGFSPDAKLFFLKWNVATTNFNVQMIPFQHPDGNSGGLEHVSFAPINLPIIQP